MYGKINLDTLTPEDRAIVEARRAYKKAWRAENKARIEEYNRRFYAKHKNAVNAEDNETKGE